MLHFNFAETIFYKQKSTEIICIIPVLFLSIIYRLMLKFPVFHLLGVEINDECYFYL